LPSNKFAARIGKSLRDWRYGRGEGDALRITVKVQETGG
jgi:hypothetical protein